MYARSALTRLASSLVFCVVLACNSVHSYAQHSEDSLVPTYRVSTLESNVANDTLTISLHGDTTPAYTVSERFAPFRVIVDIAGAEVAPELTTSADIIPSNPIGSVSIQDISDGIQAMTRFEITVAETHDYSVTRDKNDITIELHPVSLHKQLSQLPTHVPAITDIVVGSDAEETTILLRSTALPSDYHVGTIEDASQEMPSMFIDFPGISIREILPELAIGTAVARVRSTPQGNGARIYFDSSSHDLFPFDVQPTAEGLLVRVRETLGALPANVMNVAATKQETITDDTLDELIESSSSLLSKSKEGGAMVPDAVAEMQDSFAFSGYKNQRITVDFYKIDIHNVFRLFRQITDLNIIVDEAVSGTLTLALDDVPWDFALDIILNLQDLEKVERYNTIVIYPKKKEFVWPERAMDNLSFEADVEVVEQEALVIEKSATISDEAIKAKEFLRKADEAEKKGKYEEAITHYEQAATLWPTNTAIYNRLATIYLINLNNNSKAVYYAKKGLKTDPRNYSSALYAAIGSANMQQNKDAAHYFSQAISGNPPMKEALFSYASFSENTNQFATAIKLLDKYHKYHGETVDTMLAKARVYDKMGKSSEAAQQYKALLASGYQISPDLRDYIASRVSGSY